MSQWAVQVRGPALHSIRFAAVMNHTRRLHSLWSSEKTQQGTAIELKVRARDEPSKKAKMNKGQAFSGCTVMAMLK